MQFLLLAEEPLCSSWPGIYSLVACWKHCCFQAGWLFLICLFLGKWSPCCGYDGLYIIVFLNWISAGMGDIPQRSHHGYFPRNKMNWEIQTNHLLIYFTSLLLSAQKGDDLTKLNRLYCLKPKVNGKFSLALRIPCLIFFYALIVNNVWKNWNNSYNDGYDGGNIVIFISLPHIFL